MAIHVSLFAGDSETVRRCLESVGDPQGEFKSKGAEELGFKFGIMPEQAFNALINFAVQITNAQPFRFEDCVIGRLAHDGESFKGTVNGRFIEFFAGFPESRIDDLSADWTTEMRRIYDAEFPSVEKRRRRVVERAESGIQAVIFGAVMLPILVIAQLSPSFRRDRARNRKKRIEGAVPEPKTNRDLVSDLLRVCRAAWRNNDEMVYTWHI